MVIESLQKQWAEDIESKAEKRKEVRMSVTMVCGQNYQIKRRNNIKSFNC